MLWTTGRFSDVLYIGFPASNNPMGYFNLFLGRVVSNTPLTINKETTEANRVYSLGLQIEEAL